MLGLKPGLLLALTARAAELYTNLIIYCSKLILKVHIEKKNWSDLLTTMKLNAHAGTVDVRITCIFCTPISYIT
jgi:hypothetical protein